LQRNDFLLAVIDRQAIARRQYFPQLSSHPSTNPGSTVTLTGGREGKSILSKSPSGFTFNSPDFVSK
jgi:hypothetical protein